MPQIVGSVLFVLIPVALLLGALVFYVLESGKIKRLKHDLEEIEETLGTMPYLSMENKARLLEALSANPEGAIEKSLSELFKEAEVKYSGRWLPPLEQELNAERFELSFAGQKSFFVAAMLLLLGFFQSLFYGVRGLPEGLPEALLWLPAAAGFAAAFILIYGSEMRKKSFDESLTKFNRELSRVFPVFNDRSGSALLVEDMLQHESKVEQAIHEFNQTARYLADHEFSQGIQRSVQKIMQEEIAPPITESSRLLHDLSNRLLAEQKEGMGRLAEEFSRSVSKTLVEELNPIAKELRQLAQLMQDTREFIHDSVAVLETSRQQNIELNRDLSESLKLMTVAKNDLANEMNEISSNLEVISNTTGKMATLYAGEEARLSERIHTLSTAMDHALESISEALSSSAKSLELASSIRTDQESQNSELIERLTQMTNEMGEISRTLLRSSQNFTKESSAYVNQTLKNFDSGLAEVVERLIFTASAIRDAVDALPVALRPNTDN